jgi:outer membrane protein assembly factor BamB
MKLGLACVAALAAAVSLTVVGCDEHSYLIVSIVSGPDHVVPGEPATFTVTSRANAWSPTFQYEMHWGDTVTLTPKGHSAGDTDRMTHVWREPGTYQVWATAQLLKHQEYSYLVDASPRRTVIVSSEYDPVIDSAMLHFLWRPTELAVWAHDPAGESLRLCLEWSDGYRETTAFAASPCQLRALRSYTGSGQCSVVFKALNKSGAVSAPETLAGTCNTNGQVVNFWRGTFDGSPAVVGVVVYIIAPNDLLGLRESSLAYNWPGQFAGHMSFSGQVNHLYVETEDGYLRAFTPGLIPVWWYPPRESVPGLQCGPAAVKGNTFYVPCSNDSIYCLIDSGTSATRGAAFSAAQVDAVVLDSAGNVYFGDGEGGLLKLTAGLNLVWRVQLQPEGVIYAPVIGASGTIYCTSALNYIYAVSAADGSVKWTAALAGTCYRPVVGSDGLFAGTTAGIFYKLDLGSGATLWQSPLGNRPLNPAPILVTGGSAYVQTDDDRLYCVNLLNGDSVWVCNAFEYLPPQPHIPRRFSGDVLSPTVDTTGWIYMVGSRAFYRLRAYAPLDASAPWPKWQHDLYNTGYVGGGR